MFMVDLVPAPGIGAASPVRLRTSQMVVRDDSGTAICIIADYGPNGTYVVVKAGDRDFNRILKELGLSERTTCENMTLRNGQGVITG